MLFEVYRCVQLNRWSVVCGCVLHRGQRGEVWCVASTLCRYGIRMGLLLVRSWARGDVLIVLRALIAARSMCLL